MAEDVLIEIQAVDEATRAFEQVQAAGEDAANALEEGHRSAQEASENYQDEIESVADSKQELTDVTTGMTDMLVDNWMEITAVTGGAAAGVEGMTRQLQNGEEAARQVAVSTDLTTASIRDMANEMADATFSFEEATELMQIARQRGLEAEEQLHDFATQWDAVGDAAGESAIALAENSAVLEALGQDADNVEEAYDAFGYIIQDTTMDIREFMRSAERVSPQMREMGMELEEGAALLGLLEDQGLSGRYAMRELRNALRDSEGSMEQMLETMDISQEEFEEYIGQVEDSGEVVEEYADKHKETRTPMQEFRAQLEAIAGEAYGVFEVLSELAIPLAVIGPKIKALAVSTKALTAAKTVLLGVLGGISAPVWGIVAAIAALGAAMIVFRDEIRGAMGGVWDTFKDMIAKIGEIPGRMYEVGRNIVSSIAGGIRDMFSAPIDAIRDLGGSIINSIQDRIGLSSPAKEFIKIGVGMGEGITYGLEDMEKDLIQAGRMAGSAPTQAAGGADQTDVNVERTGSDGPIDIIVPLEYHEEVDYQEIKNKIDRAIKRARRKAQL